MNFSRLISLVLLLIVCNCACAQDYSVKAEAKPNRILLGEPIKLTVEIKLPESAALSFTIDSIEHFEFLEAPQIDTTTSNGQKILNARYTITSFDSGHWVIPSWEVAPNVRSDSIPIDVVYSDYNPDQEYHDIKDIIPVKEDKKTPWWWYAAGGAVLLVAIAVYLLKKKKPVSIKKPAAVIDPYKEAIKDLELLKRSKPDAKAFHSKLTDIFRLYIFRRKGILSLQKTTDDLVVQLKTLDIPKDEFDKLAQALRLSDFVKFAKFVPSSNDDDDALSTIGNAIIKIEKTTIAASEEKKA
jgi:hypothetical protein